MSVGLADDLGGTEFTQEFNTTMRRTANGQHVKDGAARIESIKGNSVVWNQLSNPYVSAYVAQYISIDGGIFVITSDVSNTEWLTVSKPIAYKTRHYYYYNFSTRTNPTSGFYSEINSNTVRANVPMIIQSEVDKSTSIALRLEPGNLGVKFEFQVIDLTHMFGPGNEPTTIDEFYARIPMGVDLNAYNEGEVIHMRADGIKSVGVNAWDEILLNEVLNSNGATVASESRTTTSYIRVLPNATYYLKLPSLNNTAGRQAFYDEDKNFILFEFDGARPNTQFTTPPNAAYMRYCFTQEYGTTYNHDICFNLSDASINGQYFPYIKRVEDLAVIGKYFPDGMKSAGTIHDEIRYNKTTQKWEKVVRIGEVDMGTLQWNYNDSIMHFSAVVQDLAIKSDYYERLNGVICSLYPADTQIEINTNALDKSIKRYQKTIYIRDSSYTDAESFTAAMQGVILYYELAEPIVAELDDEDQFKNLGYQVWNGGTESIIVSTPSTPLIADVTYNFKANA
jgi:hypothetical protein